MKHSLRSWLWRVDITQEVDEEIAFHVEMRTRELIESGMDPRIAREMVLARFGDVGRLKRTCVDLGRKRDREMRMTLWLEEFRADVTSALRQMKASPGFTLVAALTLALGIGANSAIFALADATFLRPLPFTAPHDRLVMIWERFPNGFLSQVTPPDYHDWAELNQSFDAMAAFLGVSVKPNETQSIPQLYVPIAQNSWFFASLSVRPRTGPAEALLPAVRAAVARVDKERPITRVRTIDVVASEATSRPRFRAVLVGTFAVLALTLAMVGVFGVLAYSVQQRMREFGVRIALGAARSDVMRLVLGSGVKLTLFGLVIGLTSAAILSRFVTTLVYPVQPLDPVTFMAVPIVLVTTAAIAVAAPAWRAARVDPVVAFRSE